jgi:hypothetical protein
MASDDLKQDDLHASRQLNMLAGAQGRPAVEARVQPSLQAALNGLPFVPSVDSATSGT